MRRRNFQRRMRRRDGPLVIAQREPAGMAGFCCVVFACIASSLAPLRGEGQLRAASRVRGRAAKQGQKRPLSALWAPSPPHTGRRGEHMGAARTFRPTKNPAVACRVRCSTGEWRERRFAYLALAALTTLSAASSTEACVLAATVSSCDLAIWPMASFAFSVRP